MRDPAGLRRRIAMSPPPQTTVMSRLLQKGVELVDTFTRLFFLHNALLPFYGCAVCRHRAQ
jgi:hypothetical protein